MPETLTQLVTYDDYRELPDDGNQYQIIGGELFMTAAPYSRHQRIARNIFRIIDQHAYKNELGEALFSPIDIAFSMTDIVQPDILFVSKDRLNIITEKNIVAAPELVVEVLSKSTKNIDRNLKKELYAQHGVEEYWLADPESASISQFILKNDKLELFQKADMDSPVLNCHVLKGLTADIRPIFE
jgi:Uma2 family endonuclease